MDQQVLVALIGVVGGVLSAIVQFFIKTHSLKSEAARALRMSATEYEHRMLERRFEHWFEFIAELISVSDPSIESQLD